MFQVVRMNDEQTRSFTVARGKRCDEVGGSSYWSNERRTAALLARCLDGCRGFGAEDAAKVGELVGLGNEACGTTIGAGHLPRGKMVRARQKNAHVGIKANDLTRYFEAVHARDHQIYEGHIDSMRSEQSQGIVTGWSCENFEPLDLQADTQHFALIFFIIDDQYADHTGTLPLTKLQKR